MCDITQRNLPVLKRVSRAWRECFPVFTDQSTSFKTLLISVRQILQVQYPECPSNSLLEIINNLAKIIGNCKGEIENIQVFLEKYNPEHPVKIFFKLSSLREDRDSLIKWLDLQATALQSALLSVNLYSLRRPYWLFKTGN